MTRRTGQAVRYSESRESQEGAIHDNTADVHFLFCPRFRAWRSRPILIGLRALLRTYFRLSVSGRENLPADRSFIMICNHTSHLDALCLLSGLPLLRLHRAYPAAAADYFFSNLPRALLSVIFVNGLPFDRVKRGKESLELCRQLLDRAGNILILFPEGTRGAAPDTVGRFRSGIGRLAAGTRTPVVPCYLAGAGGALPKGAVFPRPHRLRLHIGAPQSFPDASPDDTGAVASICDTLRNDVLELAGKSRPP